MAKTTKKNLFLNREITKVRENFTDLNFIKVIPVNGKSVLIIGIDSNELYSDQGFVEKKILHAISGKINQVEYDVPLLLIHHFILGTDEEPLKNSKRVIDFVRKHKIETVFCGHTHELELSRSVDLYHGHTFTQFMCGSLSSCNHANDDNMFLYYENWGTDNSRVHLVRIFNQGGNVHFEREYIEHLQIVDFCFNVIRDDQDKYVHFAALPPLFFDLNNDPDELHNLAGDLAYTEMVLKYATRCFPGGWSMTNER
jgi:hypothetical protein